MLRNICIVLIGVIICLGGSEEIFGQKYPDRPITLVIPTPPGDGTDVSGRLMAETLSKLLNVPITPLNKPGAASTAGTDMVVKAKKDGYTILLTPNASLTSTKILEPEVVPYDPFKDLTPLGLSTLLPMMLVVRKDAPYNNLKELLEYANKNPGKIRCSTFGLNSISDLDAKLFQIITGASIVTVPFKGSAPAVPALLGGHIEAMCSTVPVIINFLRSGKIKGIVGSKHLAEFPDVPTLKELHYKQDLINAWTAFFSPTELPSGINKILVSAVEKVVKDHVVSSKLANFGMVQEYESPENLSIRMLEEYKMIGEIAKEFGMVK